MFFTHMYLRLITPNLLNLKIRAGDEINVDNVLRSLNMLGAVITLEETFWFTFYLYNTQF